MMGSFPIDPNAAGTSQPASSLSAGFYMSDVYAALDSAAEPELQLPACVTALVSGWRQRLLVTGQTRISKLTKLTAAAFRVHFELSRARAAQRDLAVALFAAGGKKAKVKAVFSACPVVKTHRCVCTELCVSTEL
jgi:hypothetical protein